MVGGSHVRDMVDAVRQGRADVAHPSTWDLLSDPRRRAVLAVVGDRDAVSLAALADAVLARTDGGAADPDGGDAREGVRTALVHSALPKLDAAGAVDYDRDAGRVVRRDHPVYESSALADRDLDAAVCRALAAERRQSVLAVAGQFAGPVALADLALHVAAVERDAALVEVGDAAYESVRASLYHRHVPKLADAGLVAFDREDGTVELADDLPGPAADLAGRDASPGSAPAMARDDDDDVWTLSGREDVIARGQSLFDRADEELFLMVTTDGLLEPACLEKLRGAVERGVDVYLGSQTDAVRDLVREEVPEVVIWEPQLDWLSLPPSRGRLGRLVMCDREAVLLGSLGEGGPGEDARETGVTAEGEDAPLVVLLRELLGSRLDHLDRQSEDFRSAMPL